jgi:hypothetical protein
MQTQAVPSMDGRADASMPLPAPRRSSPLPHEQRSLRRHARLARLVAGRQNGGMRPIHSIVLACVGAALALPFTAASVRAQSTVIYRCESPAGISLQSKPCPKGAKQTKRSIQRPLQPMPPASVPESPIAADAQPSMPVTAAADLRGPNDPYPLWQCMRADGSTFESRDGVAGRQWVVTKTDDANADGATDETAAPAQITFPAKGPIIRPYVQADAPADGTASDPPPPGAAPGHWVADQCIRLTPQQACDRYAARRDELRRQIYAAMPSERVKYAPEEQDLTSMLYAACQR